MLIQTIRDTWLDIIQIPLLVGAKITCIAEKFTSSCDISGSIKQIYNKCICMRICVADYFLLASTNALYYCLCLDFYRFPGHLLSLNQTTCTSYLLPRSSVRLYYSICNMRCRFQALYWRGL